MVFDSNNDNLIDSSLTIEKYNHTRKFIEEEQNPNI